MATILLAYWFLGEPIGWEQIAGRRAGDERRAADQREAET
jgi:hypothetical protein